MLTVTSSSGSPGLPGCHYETSPCVHRTCAGMHALPVVLMLYSLPCHLKIIHTFLDIHVCLTVLCGLIAQLLRLPSLQPPDTQHSTAPMTHASHTCVCCVRQRHQCRAVCSAGDELWPLYGQPYRGAPGSVPHWRPGVTFGEFADLTSAPLYNS
eukprot:jgi/Ulvmu1/6859/UM031_0064.1